MEVDWLEGGAKSEKLKRQFSQVEGDLDLQKIPKLVPISKEYNTTKEKKVVVVKDKDEKVTKL